jgi:serine/threonine protein kinase
MAQADEEEVSELDKYFVNEIEALQRITSPYVATISPGHWGLLRGYGWILMDFFSNGPLRSLIARVSVIEHRIAHSTLHSTLKYPSLLCCFQHSSPSSLLLVDKPRFYHIAICLLEGLNAIHEQELLVSTQVALAVLPHHFALLSYTQHRDIKPENILLDSDFNPKICDFGLAKGFSADSARTQAVNELRLHVGWSCYSSTGTQQTTVAGTVLYMSPEVHAGKRATSAADVWSAGVWPVPLCLA